MTIRGQELIAVTAQRAPPLILVRLHPFDYGHVGRVDEGVKRVIRPDGPGAVGVGGDPFELDFRATVRLHLLPSLADRGQREHATRGGNDPEEGRWTHRVYLFLPERKSATRTGL